MPWRSLAAAEQQADAFALGTSAANVVPNGLSFTSDTVDVHAMWPGASQTVTWNNALIQVGTTVHVTATTTRIRVAHQASVAGSVIIERSSGTIADEEFDASLGGTP